LNGCLLQKERVSGGKATKHSIEPSRACSSSNPNDL
jgi:hypothetical protein